MATKRPKTASVKKVPQTNALVGLISRIDYGSKGFRKALLIAGFDYFRQVGTHFNLLCGGLIAKDPVTRAMKEYVSDNLGKVSGENRKEKKQELEERFLRRIANELSEIIPHLTIPNPENPKELKAVDLFVVTSPAFDGDIGERVVHYLSERRPDIRPYNAGGDRFEVLYVDKLVWALTPTKGIWMRSDYYSTPAERIIKDKIKQTTQSMPDLFVVGCLASNINKPKGELDYSYVTVPACHRLEETRVSENQVGVSVLEFPADGGQYLYRTQSLKDMVSRELSFVVPPPSANGVQRKMIEYMKKHGSATPGIFKHRIPELAALPVDEIKNLMDRLMKAKTFGKLGENFPGVTFSEANKKYYFDLEWIQRRLKYGRMTGPHQEDRIIAFCCLHAGSIETDYEFFVNRVPEIILAHNATVLVNAGDTKEGLKHHLDKKGETIAGINNTQQEKFAAHLIGEVIFRVFKERFAQHAARLPKEKGEKDAVLHTHVSQSLLRYCYRLGNHDLWESEEGHEPLAVFQFAIEKFLVHRISEYLASHGLHCKTLGHIVSKHVSLTDFFHLASGLKVSVQHPHMPRAKTTSIRPQEMLEFGKRADCQVTIGGNFHVSEVVAEWSRALGQCVSLECGTIKHGSNFERNKMKMVDQGVGYLRILSSLEDHYSGDELRPRIVLTETAFYGEPRPRPPVDNVKLLNHFIEGIGVPSISR